MPQMLRMVSFTPSVHRLRRYQREPTIELSLSDLEPIFDGPSATIHPLRRASWELTMELDISDCDVFIGDRDLACAAGPRPPPVPRRSARRLAPLPAFRVKEHVGKGRAKPVKSLALVGALPNKELNVERMAMPLRWGVPKPSRALVAASMARLRVHC